MKHLLYSLSILFILFVSGCETENETAFPVERTTEELYKAAVTDAMIADSNEISTSLIAIKPGSSNLEWSGSYVLVVTWTKYGSSYPANDTISTWWGETWVTAVPELKDWHKSHTVSQENLVLRTEQLLGLPANSGNIYFAELWVKPEDLLRPAYDNEINDNTCGLFFPENTSADYVTWFNNNIVYSYYPQKNKNKYPWTRLGYTYDWGNAENEIGLSEFIIKKDASVIVKALYPTELYIQPHQ